MRKRLAFVPVTLVLISLLIFLPVVRAQSPMAEYWEKAMEVEKGGAGGTFPNHGIFPAPIHTCQGATYHGIPSLKIYYLYIEAISLARSGYKGDKLIELKRTIESLQEGDGSFPPIPLQETVYYPWSIDGMTFEYCEESRAGSTALALLALLDAGESPNSKVVQRGVHYLLKTVRREPYSPDENVSQFVPQCYGENWSAEPCRLALPDNVTKGAYWTTRVCRAGRDGYSVCIEVPGVVTTAYAAALLHKLGYDVGDELKFLREYLTLGNLMDRPLGSCCIGFANFSTGDLKPGEVGVFYSPRRPPWWWMEDLSFPVNDFDFRDPYESLALALLYLKAEGIVPENNATRAVVRAIKEAQMVPGKTVYAEVSGYKRPGPSTLLLNVSPLRVLNLSLREDYKGEFYAYYGFRFPNGTVKIGVNASGARAGAVLISKVDSVDGAFLVYPYPACNKGPDQGDECFSHTYPSSIFNYSWSSDVYSTAVALIWLYVFNETDYEGFRKGLEYLEGRGLEDGSRSFDGYAYALIALSLQNGHWNATKPGPAPRPPWSARYTLFVLAVVLALLAVYLWRRHGRDKPVMTPRIS